MAFLKYRKQMIDSRNPNSRIATFNSAPRELTLFTQRPGCTNGGFRHMKFMLISARLRVGCCQEKLVRISLSSRRRCTPASVRWSYSVFLWPESSHTFSRRIRRKGRNPTPDHRPSALRTWATTASTMRGHALPWGMS